MDKRDKHIYKLKNGIKVIIIPLDTILTHISISFMLGVNHETKDQMEVTHFLEHLMGRMTSKKYQDDKYISEEIAKCGAYTNAYVSNYETKFYIQGFYKDLDFFFDILSNTISDFHLDENIAKKEKKAVIQELQNIISDHKYDFNFQMSKYLYPKYAYKFDDKRHIDFIKSYDISILEDFIANHILLNNMIISISCPKTSIIKTKKLIDKHFGKLKNKNKKNAIITYPIFEHKNNHLRVIYIKNKNNDQNCYVSLCINKKIEYLSKEHLSLLFLKEALFNFETGVFYNVLRKKMGMIYNINMDLDVDMKESRSSKYTVTTSTHFKNIPELIYTLLDIFRSYEITDSDINNARNIIIFAFENDKFYNLSSYNRHFEKLLLYDKNIIEKSSILRKFLKMRNEDVKHYWHIMKRDVLKKGILFYYANANKNAKIKSNMNKQKFACKFHTITK